MHSARTHARCQLLQSCGRSSPRCCRWWWAWTSTPPGTTACVRSRPCWRWRWCRWSWCNHRRSNGLCCARRCLKPRRKWSLGPSSPDKTGRTKAPVSGYTFVNTCQQLSGNRCNGICSQFSHHYLQYSKWIWFCFSPRVKRRLFTRWPPSIPITFIVELQQKLSH